MFTGIIQQIGEITKTNKSTDKGLEIAVYAENFFKDSKIGSSIAINGVCLTITKKTDSEANFDIMRETTDKSTFQNIAEGDKVNLEEALSIGGKLEGHFVQGHVDTTGEIVEIREEDSQKVIKIKYNKAGQKYLTPKGSISINGVSLTISHLDKEHLEVSLIKHTLGNTNLSSLKTRDKVNLEYDMLAKHIKSLLNQ
ncbi:riboflavin synthase [Candidatus Peregrinibacteria bacterium]|jgi:riboflavin synthase|nr:riboflavin synthase [Candidatus Peregrinibacteria bacterium]MBT4056413.1 riboflavin synthase [Candidatus Peregrinibacteria bacterium]